MKLQIYAWYFLLIIIFTLNACSYFSFHSDREKKPLAQSALPNFVIDVRDLHAFSRNVLDAKVGSGRYQIRQMTADLAKALTSQRSRKVELDQYKKEQWIGEGRNGFVEILVDDKTVRSIVKAENKDRDIIYQALLDQNKLAGAKKILLATFAQNYREQALPGHMIQTLQGQWQKRN